MLRLQGAVCPPPPWRATSRGRAGRGLDSQGSLTPSASPFVDVAPSTGQHGASLLGLRRASWPFARALTRSAAFEVALARHEQLRHELAQLQDQLVARLHDVVPGAPDSRARRAWLELKRAIFNQRLPSPAAEAPPGLEARVERYGALLDALETLLPACAETVVAQTQARLRAAAEQPDFRAALAYSSPDLVEALARSSPADGDFSALDRGLYAYLARFTTKANPLHLFARWLAAGAESAPAEADCELIVHSADLLALEARLSSLPQARKRQWLHLRPYRWLGDRWEFWLQRKDGWRLATLRDSPLLRRLAASFEARRRDGRAAVMRRSELALELAADLDAKHPNEALEVAQAAIASLLERGLLSAFLVRDLFDPAPDLTGLDAAAEPMVTLVGRWHLARVGVEDLPRLEAELVKAAEGPSAPGRPSYYVNGFAADELGDAEAAARELGAPLGRLKPLFAVEHNFSPVQRVLHSFYAEHLAERGYAPYLELLARFLRQRHELLERLGWGREARDFIALRQRCSALWGELDQAQLDELLGAVQGSGVSGPAPALCFAGPFDFRARRFFLTNVFAGEGRFASRYRLERRRALVARSELEGEVLDVELVPPPVPSLNFVVQRFAVGCGFEARWGLGYERWIEPSGIEVHWQEGRVSYVDGTSGQRLRFHPRGFLLAQYLPIECQLLLADHGDSYRNPFDEIAPVEPQAEVLAIPGAWYGPVCLRRPVWCLRRSAVLAELEKARTLKSHALEGAARLRRFVHARCGVDENLWFYSLPQAGRRAEKPRLLDLLDPLSVLAFRRALASGRGVVSLTRMDPAPAGLWQHDGEGYACELMVEA